MIESFKNMYELLDRSEIRTFMLLILVIVIEAMLEMVGIILIPIYVSIIAFPSYLEKFTVYQDFDNFLRITLSYDGHIIYLASIVLLFFFTFKMIYQMLSTYWKSSYSNHRALNISRKLYKAYLEAPFDYHLSHGSHELIRNVNTESMLMSTRVLMPMITLVSQSAILIGVFIVLMISTPMIVIVWLLFFLLVGLSITAILNKRVRGLGKDSQKFRALLLLAVREGLEGVKEIKVLQRTEYFIKRLGGTFSKLQNLQIKMGLIQSALPNIVELITMFGLVGIALLLFSTVDDPFSIIPTLTILAVAFMRLKGVMRGIMRNITAIQHASASLEVIHDGLELLNNEECSRKYISNKTLEFKERIDIKNLEYKYPESTENVIDGINLEILKGEMIGFVGATGSGKSTLIDILLGILTQTNGSIMVDNVDIKRDISGWQKNIGYIPQTIFLINGSLSQNIALGVNEKDINSDRLNAAIKISNLTKLVLRLPQGINANVGERGVLLSGGERQRIAIARAIYLNPTILVMDEATSSLDNITESQVIEKIGSLKGERTLLIVAHRLSTVKRCNKIVFIKEGKIDAIGTYNELIESHDEFSRMASLVE